MVAPSCAVLMVSWIGENLTGKPDGQFTCFARTIAERTRSSRIPVSLIFNSFTIDRES